MYASLLYHRVSNHMYAVSKADLAAGTKLHINFAKGVLDETQPGYVANSIGYGQA